MPAAAKHKQVVFRASAEYRAALDAEVAALEARGVAVGSVAGLIDLALRGHFAATGRTLPPRVAPVGTNRFGEPSKKIPGNPGMVY